MPANAVCDVNGELANGQFSYGFLGTTDDSYRTDVPSNLPTVPHAIDGFKVVKGQKIVLHDTADANGVPCVTGPAAREYLPGGASSFEGRYPVRFSMRAEERAYYAVTCTVANASSTAKNLRGQTLRNSRRVCGRCSCVRAGTYRIRHACKGR